MNKSSPIWLVNVVANGIALLMGARFQGSPFGGNQQDTQAVCESWLVALSNKPIDWNEDADRWRIEAGFKQLLSNCRKWPAPVELFDYMPSRMDSSAQKLNYRPDLNSTERAVGFRSLNQIRQSLNMPSLPIATD
jgi:hypothetical protein